MKILWLDINSSYSHSSLALPALHAQIMGTPLESDNEWNVVRGSIKSDMDEIIAEVEKNEPEIIFATLWLFTHEFVVNTLARIKALRPDVIIVLGGPEFLGDNESFLRRNDEIDAVFRGEGEEFLAQWLPICKSRERWLSVKGLCFLLDGGYVDGGKAVVKDFASLRYPEESPFFVADRSFVQLETTRGCFNSCQFCVSGADKPVRSLSIEQIRSRLDFYAKKGISSIRMLDRTFNGSPKRCHEMLELMNEYHGRLTFHLEIHPSLLKNEIREELKRMPAGLLHLEAGIQSLHDEVLQECTRNGDVESALDGLKFLFTLADKMETHTDLIAGLPLYPYKELVEDARILVTMNAGEVQLETLKVLPGTRMRERAEELGLRYSPRPPYEIMSTPAISYNELRRAMILSRLLDIYFNHSPLRDLFRDIALKGFETFQQVVDFFDKDSGQLFFLSLENKAKKLFAFIKEYTPELIKPFQRVWIENGINMNTLPGLKEVLPIQYDSPLNDSIKSCNVDADSDKSHDQKSDEATRRRIRSYHVVTENGSWIVRYDRSASQNVPIEITDYK